MTNKITFPYMKNHLLKAIGIETKRMKLARLNSGDNADWLKDHPDPSVHQFVIKFEYEVKDKILFLSGSNINPRVNQKVLKNYSTRWWEYELQNKHKLQEALKKFGFEENEDRYSFFIDKVSDIEEASRIVQEFKDAFYPDAGETASNKGTYDEGYTDPYGNSVVNNPDYDYHYFYFYTKLEPLKSKIKKLRGRITYSDLNDIDVWFGILRKDYKFFIVLFNWGYWWYYDVPRVPQNQWEDVLFWPEIKWEYSKSKMKNKGYWEKKEEAEVFNASLTLPEGCEL